MGQKTIWGRVDQEDAIQGCTDSSALNYLSSATVDNGSCTYLPSQVPGCTNVAASNYSPSANVDDGSCTFSNSNVTFNTAGKKTIETKIGANIFQTYDSPYLASWTAQGIEIALQAYYITFSSKNTGNATIFNNFLTAVGSPDVMIYLPIGIFTGFPTFHDWIVSTFSPDAIQLDQESALPSKGLADDTYISRSRQVMARYPSIQASWDSTPVYMTAPNKLPRNEALAPLTDTDWGRQYEQISPDRVMWDATDNDYNLTLINYVYGTLLPDDIVDFDLTLPNVDKQVILQWQNSDTGTTNLSQALATLSVGEMARFTLANTEKFAYLFWMRFAELVRPSHNSEFYDIKLIVPCFKFTWTMSVTMPYNFCSAQAFQTGANSWGLLVTNQGATQQTIAAGDIVISGKTVSGNFTRNSRYSATGWGGTIITDTNISEASAIIRPYGVNVITFTTV